MHVCHFISSLSIFLLSFLTLLLPKSLCILSTALSFAYFFFILLWISTLSLTLLLKFHKGKYKVPYLGRNNPMQQSIPEDYWKESCFSEKDLVCTGCMARTKSLALLYHRDGITSESTSSMRQLLHHFLNMHFKRCAGSKQGEAVISVMPQQPPLTLLFLVVVLTHADSPLLKKVFNAQNHFLLLNQEE